MIRYLLFHGEPRGNIFCLHVAIFEIPKYCFIIKPPACWGRDVSIKIYQLLLVFSIISPWIHAYQVLREPFLFSCCQFLKAIASKTFNVIVLAYLPFESKANILVIYLCIQNKWNPGITSRWHVTYGFKVWRACFLHQKSIGFTLARHKLSATAEI